MTLHKLIGHHLKEVLGKMRHDQALGLECWRVAELKQLPLCLLNRLAVLFETIEVKGTWPEGLERATVNFVQEETALLVQVEKCIDRCMRRLRNT